MTTLNAERVGRPVVHGLDVVAVRIEQEGRVIAGMVSPGVPLSRPQLASPARLISLPRRSCPAS
jgi:hypothetical protein